MEITNCKYCNSTNLKITVTPETIHYGRWDCGHCKRFSHWARNPQSERNGTLRTNHKTVLQVCDFHQMKEEICFFCLRDRNKLGAKETLTIDHIIELDKGGLDQLWNMQILCSACHKLKNWARLYMNWHFNKGETINDDSTPD